MALQWLTFTHHLIFFLQPLVVAAQLRQLRRLSLALSQRSG